MLRAKLAMGLAGCVLAAGLLAVAEDAAPIKWIPARAHAVVPKYTANEGEGYFSIITGHNGRQYIGTHANAINSWLVEFDPQSEKMNIVVDAHKAIGVDLKGFGAQSKIHTRNNVGESGKIYFGTKQGYPDAAKEKREDYPGGYPMVYDPATGQTKVYPIPVKHHGINSIMPDESRNVAYISTCSDHRPGPSEGAVFLAINLTTGEPRYFIDTQHYYGFIVIDHKGRAYHPLLGGDIIRYDPNTDRLERLTQTIDGAAPTPESRLAGLPPDPINWDISPDKKTLYSMPMTSNHLFAYDLTAEGTVLPGKDLGELIKGGKETDCRAMCCGPKGDVWCAITENTSEGNRLHVVSYRPGEAATVDHGVPSVTNQDFTELVDKEGKPLPFHGGFFKRADGHMTTKYVILGVSQAQDETVYVLALHPYSILQIPIKELRP